MIGLSSDHFLKFKSVKVESLVIVNKRVTVNGTRASYTLPVTPREFGYFEITQKFLIPRSLSSHCFRAILEQLGRSRNMVMVGEPVVGGPFCDIFDFLNCKHNSVW